MGVGQREMELGDTEGSEQVTELNEGEVGRSERTQGKAREPQGSHWEAAPAWAGGLAKAAETGPTADISALPTTGTQAARSGVNQCNTPGFPIPPGPGETSLWAAPASLGPLGSGQSIRWGKLTCVGDTEVALGSGSLTRASNGDGTEPWDSWLAGCSGDKASLLSSSKEELSATFG